MERDCRRRTLSVEVWALLRLSRVAISRSFLVVLLCTGCALPLRRFEYARSAMGTEFRLAFYGHDATKGDEVAQQVFALIEALEQSFSDYDEGSELARLGACSDLAAPTEWVPLSEDLFAVLAEAQALARASDGAFDVTAGPYALLWRRARRQGELPREERLAAVAPAVGHARLELDARARSARLHARGMRLDLGGIGKGYALDQALDVLRQHGIERALVVGGGEMLAAEPPPGQAGWHVELVGLEGGVGRLELAHAALATSGDLAQALVLDGRHHSHILDPRTGRALTERRLVSVIGPRATGTDALATALSVLGLEAGMELLERHPGYEARFQVLREAGIEERCSPGFPRPLSWPERDPAPTFVPARGPGP
jgi:thiamine biosynthesis lipoprotein